MAESAELGIYAGLVDFVHYDRRVFVLVFKRRKYWGKSRSACVVCGADAFEFFLGRSVFRNEKNCFCAFDIDSVDCEFGGNDF